MDSKRKIVFIAAGLAAAVALAYLLSGPSGLSGREGVVRPAGVVESDAAPARTSDRTRPATATPSQLAARPGSGATEIDPGASKAPAKTEVVVEGRWGSGPGQFGRRQAQESNPEAPMAISAGRSGEVWIADHANGRLVRYENGKPVASIALSSDAVQDLALTPDGKIAALDRLVDKSIHIYDQSGKLIDEVPLAGKRIPDPSAVTGVFADEDGIWVERDHGEVVRVARPEGAADAERPEAPGRPTRDGRFRVTAALTRAEAGELVVNAFERNGGAHAWMRPLRLEAPILHLLMLESDDQGNVFVAAAVGRESAAPPYPIVDEAIIVVRLDPEGRPTGSIRLPPLQSGDEMQRPLAVTGDGAVLQMVPGESGLQVMRHGF